MADTFHFDASAYRKRVSRIAQHVVGGRGAIPTIAPHDAGVAASLSEGALTTRNEVGRRVNVVARRQMT